MKRIALMVAKLLYIVPYWFFRMVWLGSEKHYDEEKAAKLLRKMVTRIIKAGRVTVECYGLENLPEQNGYIMFPNHEGLFDSLVFMQVHERPFSLISKKEVKDVILIKQVMRLMRALPMDRNDVRQSMKVIMQVTKEVKEGRNYLIFPEGTRAGVPNQMHPFKAGSFKSATQARCPIVPVALVDTYKAFDSGSAKPITVQIHFLEPLYYEEYQGKKTQEIAQDVQSRIAAALREYAPEEDAGTILEPKEKE
ncbi:lysophospholipid acyltransferase family protein [Anaerolentibacter hominis]|uniref:lysophospholipid acyltransferase family protein n=1 Tax=Anaerolentibacter hominis TaxID=3079009 RepID=UPI0031B81936